MAKRKRAIGNPIGELKMFVKSIPIITGKIIIAPKLLNLFVSVKIPPVISIAPTKGINQLISIRIAMNFIMD